MFLINFVKKNKVFYQGKLYKIVDIQGNWLTLRRYPDQIRVHKTLVF